MNHSTTLFIGLDVHKDTVSVAYVTAVRSQIAIRKITLAGGVQILSWLASLGHIAFGLLEIS